MSVMIKKLWKNYICIFCGTILFMFRILIFVLDHIFVTVMNGISCLFVTCINPLTDLNHPSSDWLHWSSVFLKHNLSNMTFTLLSKSENQTFIISIILEFVKHIKASNKVILANAYKHRWIAELSTFV